MTPSIDEFLGGRLRKRRRLLGLTQSELARRVDLRFQQIQKYECGANKITAARIWELALALDVTVEYFFDGFGELQSSPTSVALTGRLNAAPKDLEKLIEQLAPLKPDIRKTLSELALSLLARQDDE